MLLAPVNPHIYIQDEATWQTHLPDLLAADQLAFDLESNSMYAYRESICLIQVSTRTQDYIIDPYAPVDIAPLEEIFVNTAVEKIFHAGEYDLMLLQNERGWVVNNLFDTMWAARILGYDKIGLANMLDALFDLKLDKRFQRTNWGRRPLRDAELAYAQRDTHYLFDLRDRLAADLQAQGCWVEAQELFQDQTIITPRDNGFDPDGFWSLPGVRELSRPQRAVLKELYLLRDEIAAQQDLPVFKVIHNNALVALAAQEPTHPQDLHTVSGLSRRQIQHNGRRILRAVAKGLKAPPPKRPPSPPKPPDAVLSCYDTLHRWRKERGLERGVESDVIASRDALWSMAEHRPTTIDELARLNVFGPWRLAEYGPELLEVIGRC